MTDHLETGTLADVTETEEGSSLVVDVRLVASGYR